MYIWQGHGLKKNQINNYNLESHALKLFNNQIKDNSRHNNQRNAMTNFS